MERAGGGAGRHYPGRVIPPEIVSLPKVVLHDHLDGGLRPETVVALAREFGFDRLPTTDPLELRAWFHQSGAGSLDRYLEAFAYTCGVMQTPESLDRVAYEAVEDLAADGVVYAEVRFAPSLHTAGGLTRDEVLEAVLAGMARGERDFGLPVRIIVDALRHQDDSEEVAEAAVRFAGRGVVGFDLAGPEGGYPASLHRNACAIAAAAGLALTIHAGEHRPHPGELAPVENIADALDCGARRIGHGVLLVEDTVVADGEIIELGVVAQRVHRDRIALEVCPTSNVDTRAFPDLASHPIGLLHRAGFAVTLNTDNRLMSATTMSREAMLVMEYQGITVDDLRAMTLTAVDAAFCDEPTRESVRHRVIAGYR